MNKTFIKVLNGGRIQRHRSVWGQKRDTNGDYGSSRHADISACNSLESACWILNCNLKPWRQKGLGSRSVGHSPGQSPATMRSTLLQRQTTQQLCTYGHPVQFPFFLLPSQTFSFGVSHLPCSLRQLLAGMSEVQLWIHAWEAEFPLLHSGKRWSR